MKGSTGSTAAVPASGDSAADALAKVKVRLQAFTGEDLTEQQLQTFLASVKSRQKLQLQQPRQGIHRELQAVVPDKLRAVLAKQAAEAGLEFDPSTVKPADEALIEAEKWRDVECLALSPPTFQALKQLPELQQLISATAADVIPEAGSTCLQETWVHVCHSTHQEVKHGAPADSMQELVQCGALSPNFATFTRATQGSPFALLYRLSPHLRLALAADVAAGMLCPGQAAPPDTPEHGSTLRLFLRQGGKKLRQELREHRALARAANSSGSSSASSSGSSDAEPTRLQKLWRHVPATTAEQGQQEQQQQAEVVAPPSSGPGRPEAAAAAASGLLPPPARVRGWPLSPHIDLQLQLPPQLLLEQALDVALQLAQQRQQQQEEGGSPAGVSSADGCSAPDGTSVLRQLVQGLQQRVKAHQQYERCLQSFANLVSAELLESMAAALHQQLTIPGASGSSGGVAGGSADSSSSSSSSSCVAGGRADSSSSSSGEGDISAASAAAAVAAAVSQQGQLPVALCQAAARLSVCCLLQQVVWGDQQALPLQALQLLTSVRQLEATARAASGEAAAAAAAGGEREGGSSAEHGCQAVPHTAAQQQLVQQSLELLQHVRILQESCSSRSSTPQAVAAAAGLDGSTVGGCSSSSGAAGVWPEVMAPAQFFAADGPLACTWGCQPSGAGLWQDSSSGSSSSSSAVSSRPGASAPLTAGRSSCYAADEQQQALLLHVLVGSGVFAASQKVAWDVLLRRLLEPAMQCFALLHQAHSTTQLLNMAGRGDSGMQARCCRSALGSCGVEVGARRLLQALQLPEHLAAFLTQLRQQLCGRLGLLAYDAASWHELACGSRRQEDELDAAFRQAQQQQQQQQHDGSDSDGDDRSEPGWDWDIDMGADPRQQGGGREADGDWTWSSTCAAAHGSSSSSSSAEWQQRLELVQQLLQHQLAPEGSTLSGLQEAGAEIFHVAATATRHLATCAASKLAPLQQWHMQHVQRQQQAAVAAQQWWASKARLEPALQRATGQISAADAPQQQQQHSHSSLAGDSAARAVGRSSSAGTHCWSNGPCDNNPHCPLCQQEQRQQQPRRPDAAHPPTASATSSSSSTSAPFSQFPVPYDDPFLWRRLLWRLLGKLSPEAQAFYATHLDMRPHCCDKESWHLVTSSLEVCMWSPPDSDDSVPDMLRSHRQHLPAVNMRAVLRQYSRAVNTAFTQGYHPSLSLVSKQVLLALSPLHHQVLPPAETAHLLPSSFAPAVGKALMQQLFDSPVLDGFEHEACPLQLWHVWWHVGLRRYRWLQQRQAQLQQRVSLSHSTTTSSSSSKGCADVDAPCSSSSSSNSNSSSSSMMCEGLEDLYLDADARLYAMGFATRQLSVTPKTPSNGRSQAAAAMRDALRGSLHELADSLLFQGLPHALLQPPGQGDVDAHVRRLLSVFAQVVVLPHVAPEGLRLLRPAVAGPSDPLVPLQQQRGVMRTFRAVHGPPGVHRGLEQQSSRVPLMQVARLYLRLGDPQQWRREASHTLDLSRQAEADPDVTSSSSGGGGSAANGEAGAGEQEAAAAPQDVEASDASALMLAAPVPVECLTGPGVWWTWHQQLLGLQRCDVCDKQVAGDQQVVCAACQSALYCSEACQLTDQQHAMVCDTVAAARQRYTPNRDRSSSSSSSTACDGLGLAASQQAPGASSPGPVLPLLSGLPVISSLLQPHPHEPPGPLGGDGAALSAQAWPDSFASTETIIETMCVLRMVLTEA